MHIRGTLLFRCNDHSGCCAQKEHTCQALQEEELRVAFYTMDCNAGDTRPRPEYVIMKNHTKCGCRPPADHGFDQSPQRLQDMVCGGQGRRLRGSYSGRNGGMSGEYGQSVMTSGYGSQYSPQQHMQPSYGMSVVPPPSASSPCSNSMMAGRPLVDGQMVSGTIKITVGDKGFMPNNHQSQQQPCPYG